MAYIKKINVNNEMYDIYDETALRSENPTGIGSLSLNRKDKEDYSYVTVVGKDNSAIYSVAFASGEETTAGYRSHAEGYLTYAENHSHAEGRLARAIGKGSHAEGVPVSTGNKEYKVTDSFSIDSDEFLITEYPTDFSVGDFIIIKPQVEGSFEATDAKKVLSIAYENDESTEVIIKVSSPFRAKYYNEENGAPSNGILPANSIVTKTIPTVASGYGAHAEGHATIASGSAAHTEGYKTEASGTRSHAEGELTVASGYGAHSEGKTTEAVGAYSHTEGLETKATNTAAHAEGHSTLAEGGAAHVEGFGTVATGNYSHAEGSNSQAIGICSHTEGSETIANVEYAHAEGKNTLADGIAAHAEGYKTTADGNYSHAEGSNSKAIGNYSHTEGYGSEASGIASHAEGSQTTASAEYSHAEGMKTKASSRSQHVQGQYNVEDSSSTYAHIVGWGSSSEAKNIHTLSTGGQAWFQGDVYVGSTSGVNKDSGSKKLATEAFVNNSVKELSSAMIFKGTLGTGGTRSSLPTASSSYIGDTYKVITAGTYAGKAAKVGDVFVCSTRPEWVLIPSGDEPSGTVTNVATGTGLTGGPITSSGTISLKTATASEIGGVKSGTDITVDSNGNVSVNDNSHNHSASTINSVYDMKLAWGGNPLAGQVSPSGVAISAEHSANRIAYLNPAAIKIEYSNNGGSTWADMGANDAAKINLVTKNVSIGIGTAKPVTTNNKTRVTLTATDGSAQKNYVYCNIRKILLYVTRVGHGMTVDIETKTGVSGANWVSQGTYTLEGWSGWNEIPVDISTFGGYYTQTTNNWQLRFTFNTTSIYANTDYANTLNTINSIRVFGENCWQPASSMGENGHLYTYDAEKNAVFPAGVTATSFTGNLSGNATSATKATQDGDGNIIKNTYAKKSEIPSIATVSGTTLVL